MSCDDLAVSGAEMEWNDLDLVIELKVTVLRACKDSNDHFITPCGCDDGITMMRAGNNATLVLGAFAKYYYVYMQLVELS